MHIQEVVTTIKCLWHCSWDELGIYLNGRNVLRISIPTLQVHLGLIAISRLVCRNPPFKDSLADSYTTKQSRGPIDDRIRYSWPWRYSSLCAEFPTSTHGKAVSPNSDLASSPTPGGTPLAHISSHLWWLVERLASLQLETNLVAQLQQDCF